MKKIILLLLFCTVCTGIASAQKNFPTQKRNGKNSAPAVLKHKIAAEHGATSDGPVHSVPPSENRMFAQIAGSTTYDLQSNACMSRRIHNWGGGKVSTTWAMSLSGSETAGFADRGTGYNTFDPVSSSFGPFPTERIEGTVRTGFPSYVVLNNGDEWVFSHSGAPGAYKAHYARKASGSAAWTQGDIPITSPKGGLWLRACAGGPDGNSLHVIYNTTPLNPAGSTAFGGELINGMNGTVRYCRSSDGGATWDIIDRDLPQLSDANWVGIGGDAYNIDAHDNTVAIGIFTQTNDVVLYKSTDNGSNWDNPRVVNDFPLTKWVYDSGYSADDLTAYYDSTYYPTNMSIFTTDESGAVLVDNDGLVHVVYSSLFIADLDSATVDNSISYYPGYDLGLVYWNDTMPDNGGFIAADSPDLNGDGVWGSPENTNPEVYADGYGDAFSTGPTLGLGDDGRLYLSYITNHELNFNSDNGFWFRKPFICRTEVGNFTTWETPKCIYNNATVEFPDIANFEECYFASIARHVDQYAHICFQQDFEPGLFLRTTAAELPVANSISYIAYPLDSLTSIHEKPVLNSLAFSLAPNPATSLTRVAFDLENNANVQLDVMDAVGARVMTQQLRLPSGPQSIEVNTSKLTTGLYFVRINTGNKTGVRKLMVERK